MEYIFIQRKEETDKAWVFEVKVGEGADVTTHRVVISKNYWQKLSGGTMTPEELTRKSFEFLLAREPKESILREFELSLIQKYFSEYEHNINANH